MKGDWPQVIKDVGFDFSWDEQKVWTLDVPVTEMAMAELDWHFDIPFLWWDGGVYNLTPRAVMENPNQYQKEYDRTMRADLGRPIDVMENKGRWLILDGPHRLMKAYIDGAKMVRVRIIPREKIPEILNETSSLFYERERMARGYQLIDGIYDELMLADKHRQGKKSEWQRFDNQ